MRFVIEGADRKSGKDRTITVESDSQEEAMRKAVASGLMVSAVRGEEDVLAEAVMDEGASATALAHRDLVRNSHHR